MRPRAVIATIALLLGGAWAVRHELYPVARPGERPRPLSVVAEREQPASEVDVVLPAVPAGVQRLRSGEGVVIVHYWAPWERHASAQAHGLDSLRRAPGLEPLRVALVCFDPFPSVARFVTRQRLRLAVLLDGRRELRRALPCPSIPYTYVLDRSGRIVVAQAGEVDWWAPASLAVLRELIGEEAPLAPTPPPGT